MQTLVIESELTIGTVAEHKISWLALLESCDGLEINLVRANEIDTEGLRLLILIKETAIQKGKQLRFIMRSKEALDVLELISM